MAVVILLMKAPRNMLGANCDCCWPAACRLRPPWLFPACILPKKQRKNEGRFNGVIRAEWRFKGITCFATQAAARLPEMPKDHHCCFRHTSTRLRKAGMKTLNIITKSYDCKHQSGMSKRLLKVCKCLFILLWCFCRNRNERLPSVVAELKQATAHCVDGPKHEGLTMTFAKHY